MNPSDEPDPRLIAKIKVLDDLPERDPQRAGQGRAAFLAAAQEMSGSVTPAPARRHKGWMPTIQSLFTFHRKEQSPMFTALSSLLIILALALGGGGAAVAAAQSSQPDDLLYSLKLTSEDLRMELEGDPAAAYQLALAFAERRAQEIQTMLQAGGVPPEAVQARYQAQVEQAIQLALNQPDDQAVPALEQVKTRLQAQEQAMQQIPAAGLPDVEAARMRARAMVQERLQWVEAGLADPAQLRELLRLRYAGGEPLQPGPGNPWMEGTPTPGSDYGPGPGDGECADCTPVEDGHNSQNPWTTDTPVPGSGYGPGDGECADCTPGAGPGPRQPTPLPPQPTQAGPQPTQYQQPTQAGPQPTQSGGGGGGNKP